MSEQKPRGLFIVFEGVDRTGKSTQAKRVTEALCARGIAAYEQHFPAYETPIGGFLRKYLMSKTVIEPPPLASHLLFAANRAERMPMLEALLAGGTHVICDRYVYSGIAYSAAKGLSPWRCRSIEADLPMPDAVLYLHAPAEVLAARSGFGPERHDDVAFLTRVQEAYGAASSNAPNQRWIRIDASASPEAVTTEVDAALALLLALVDRTQPLRRLFQ
jgi:dTMP kinase